MIKNIVFDLGNVLVPIDYDATNNALSDLTTDPEEVQQDFNLLHEKYETGRISTSLFLNGVLRLAIQGTQARDVIAAWNAMLINVPDESLELIASVRENYSVYILSNTNELHIDWVNKKLKQLYGISSFDDVVDGAFYSHRIQAKKPDSEAFEKIVESADIIPEESLFLDDLEENIRAARKCGFKAERVIKFAEASETLLRGLRNYNQ